MPSAGSQEASSVTLSFLSLRHLLQEKTVTVSLPQTGVVHIPTTESEAWRRGLTLASARSEHFLAEIKRGNIPPPVRPALCSAYIPTAYSSPEFLTRTISTVADALYLTPLLVDFVLSSTETVCPSCKETLPLFTSPAALLEEVTTRHSGKSVTVELLGRPDTLEAWAINRGFLLTPVGDGLLSVVVDSCVCSPETVGRITDLLSKILATDRVALRCKQGETTSLLSLGGACSQCCTILPRFSRADVAAALCSEAHELPDTLSARIQSGISVQDIRHLPLATLFKDTPFSALIPKQLREDLSLLKLGAIALADKLSTLSNREQALLSVLFLAHNPSESTRVKVLDLPDRILGPEYSWALEQILKRCSTHSCWILLGEPCAPRFDASSPQTKDSATPSAVNIPLTPRLRKNSGLVAHALGLSEPLAKLFATSHEARIAGLASRAFNIGISARSSGSVCQRCNGYGFILDDDPSYPVVDAHICPHCSALRFIPPVSAIHFRGLTLGQIYNDTIGNLLPILKALPRARDTVALCEALGLLHTSLGMPLALLEHNEQRLVLVAQAILRSSATKPVRVILEDGGAGFTAEQHRNVQQLLAGKRTGLV